MLKTKSVFGDGYYGDGTEAVAVRRIGGGPGSLCSTEGAVAEAVHEPFLTRRQQHRRPLDLGRLPLGSAAFTKRSD